MAGGQRFGAFGAAALAALLAGACFIDFDRYDPRLGEGGGAGDGGSGAIGGGGVGGTGTGADGGGGSGATGGSGGAGGAGGGGAGPCGTPEVLADDFDDGVVTNDWWFGSGPGATLVENGGERVITLPSMQPQSSWSGFSTGRLVRFEGQRVTIEVPTAPNPATTANAFLNVIYDSQNYIAIGVRLGELFVAQYLDDAWTELNSLPYDATAHRWWQLREEAGTTYWETSPDGQTWTSHATRQSAQLFPMDLLQIEHGANTEGGEASPGSAHFDNLMGGGPPRHPWCPMGTLSDDFEDGAASRMWSWASFEGGGCQHDETGGQLVLSFDGSAIDCGYVSSQRFDLAGDSLFVEVPSISTSIPTLYTYFRAEIDSENGYELVLTNDLLVPRVEVNGNLMGQAFPDYDPAAHRWWRIREDGGTVFWDASADGTSWTELAQAAVTVPVDGLVVVMGAGVATATPMSGEVRFDNLNLSP